MEKKLRKVGNVASLEIQVTEGRAVLNPKPGTSLDLAAVEKATLPAVQEGLRNVGKQVMRNYLENCATHAIRKQSGPEIYDELMEVIYKYAR